MIIEITDSPYDFSSIHPIQTNILLEIDDPYILNEVSDEVVQARLYDRKTQRNLNIYTTYPTIVCYTDNFPMTYPLKHEAKNKTHMGVCFEAQNPPNGIHLEGIESSILAPTKAYHQLIRYVFSIKEWNNFTINTRMISNYSGVFIFIKKDQLENGLN